MVGVAGKLYTVTEVPEEAAETQPAAFVTTTL